MHLVFATSIVPCGTPQTGYEIANAAILGALQRAGVRVTILGFTWPNKAPSEPERTVVLGSVDVTTEGAPASRKVLWLAKAMRDGLTFSSAKLRIVSPETVRAVMAELEPVDGVILNSVQFAGAFEPVCTERPFIYIAHNVEYRSAEESAAAATDPVARFLFRREARLLEKLEARLCRNARFVFTLAEDDRALLGVDDDARSAALPLVTRPEVPKMQARKPDYDAALIGTWTWAPNRIGLEWFLREVAPLLPSSFRIAVAGGRPAGLEDTSGRVEFVGRAPDATAFIRSGRVVPLISRAGTGVQLKTIETFELGLPSVATTHSLRGIADIPPNCTVADDAKAFAKALEAAAANPEDVSGKAFHAAQQAALDQQISRGLSALRERKKEVAA